MSNPLLTITDLPDFAAITPADVVPAITELLAGAEAGFAAVTSDAVPADYDAIERGLSLPCERLGVAWGAVGHLNAVADSPALREAYNAMLPAVTEFFTRLGSSEALYAKYKAIAAHADALNPARRQVMRHAVRDFVLGGAELQGEAKARYAAIQERAAALTQSFSEHVLDATDAFAYFASAGELRGVPADVVAAARAAAQAESKDGHKITLQYPSYMPVMQYAEDRALRERLYRAYATRASELGDAKFDNTALMRELLALRQEEAQLLGHASFAETSLVAKMAESPAQVLAFLRDLAQRARPFAEKDLAELRAFAAGELGIAELQAWDVAFASEKLKQARYAFSDEALRPYFTLPGVLDGLFAIVERTFDVQIRADRASVWHESVRFYRVERAGRLIAQFYMDLYARPGKRSGAWMDEVRGRWLRPEGSLQTPVAQLVCNFMAPAGDAPALLTHDDVITLFHETGHGLHHMLTQVDERGVSGISGVEWDAVELPSQFMENFCWEWDVLQQLTSHKDSGAPLPRALFDKMIAAKNYQSGLMTLRQVEFALFDMRLHAEPGSDARVQDVIDEVRREVAVLPPPPFNRMQHSFSHIFAGGYAAGYYSYKWAELLSADAWSAFEEEGVFNAATGRRFLHEVLEQGGARDAIDNFKAFRGREPRIDALLRHQGMS
ncbi:M3 family metallopeptidase [Roseateles sp.]|uniref:M3 family metallopeptidase n=1 Tax=Roseateles sp. TaxID=1971397 RepID=UPI0025EB84AA|nr:M3 family metallopeptidase [Roseateles sp.]MBV8036524.1 M3 family metallopeptidase [Roseateles sp.]